MTTTSTTCTFTISGTAWHIIKDGGWGQDCPRGGEALRAGVLRNWGKGFRATITMEKDDAFSLADYLEILAEAWESMTAEERDHDGGATAKTIRKAMEAAHGAVHPDSELATCQVCPPRTPGGWTRMDPSTVTVRPTDF